MRNRVVMSFIVLVAMSGWLSAADLEIIGETKLAPYKLVELKAKGADVDAALLWDVYPEESADIREINGVLLFTAPPGVYKVKLRTVKGKTVDTARAVITISGPSPGPGPIPPGPGPVPPIPPNPGRFGLAAISQAGAALVMDSPTKAADKAKLASAQRSLASAIAAGGVPPFASNILQAWAAGNNEAVNATTWKPWGDTTVAKLRELYNGKKLLQKQDWVDAFNEIASGLE